jgi:hypothetical protein
MKDSEKKFGCGGGDFLRERNAGSEIWLGDQAEPFRGNNREQLLKAFGAGGLVALGG